MSNSLDDYGSSANPLLDAEQWYDRLAKLFPTLAAALLGNEHTRNGGPVRPPFTLMVRAKGGCLQAMLSNPDSSKTWFSAKLAPETLLEDVERSLADKTGEWIDKPKNGAGRRN
jgi:hypothetical protein